MYNVDALIFLNESKWSTLFLVHSVGRVEIGIDRSLPLGNLLPSDAAVVCNVLATLLTQHKRQRAQIMKMGEESDRLQSDVRIALKGKDGLSLRLDESLRHLAQCQNQVLSQCFAHNQRQRTAFMHLLLF
jgi:hypothetical protein